MFVTIITDCYDQGTKGRQLTRANAIFNAPANLVGVEFKQDYAAAGNLIDILDAAEGSEGIVLANVAPRDSKAKKWKNGTPFCFFFCENTLVLASIDGKVLSLVKKLNLTDKVKVFDIPTVMDNVPNKLDYYPNQKDYIINTQFRSFEFLPRAAKWIWDKIELPIETVSINEIQDPVNRIWWIDNFGNCKTNILPEEVGFEEGKTINLQRVGDIKCYRRLKDVPDGDPALVIGSSGIKDKRFLEILAQGQSAATKLNLKVGDIL